MNAHTRVCMGREKQRADKGGGAEPWSLDNFELILESMQSDNQVLAYLTDMMHR